MTTPMDFARYGSQRTEPAPGMVDLVDGRTEAQDIANEILNDGDPAIGRAVRDLVMREYWQRTSAEAAHRPRLVPSGREYLIRRLPNWRLTRWLLARVNRYLRESGSTWKLIARNRDPRPGTKYGPYSKLADADARALAIYLRRRQRWEAR